MKFRSIALATAALSLAASPAIAEAAFDRSGGPATGEAVEGEGSGLVLALLGATAVIGGIIIAAGNNSDTPTSP